MRLPPYTVLSLDFLPGGATGGDLLRSLIITDHRTSVDDLWALNSACLGIEVAEDLSPVLGGGTALVYSTGSPVLRPVADYIEAATTHIERLLRRGLEATDPTRTEDAATAIARGAQLMTRDVLNGALPPDGTFIWILLSDGS